MKKILTLLLVLVVVVSATAMIGSASGVVTLSQNETVLEFTEDATLNLGTYTLGTLTVGPDATVTVTGTGNIGSIEGSGIVVLGNTKEEAVSISGKSYSVDVSYLNIGGSTLSLGTAGVTVNVSDLTNAGANMFYKSVFGGGTGVQNLIKAYGVAMYVGSNKNLFEDKTFTAVEDLTSWGTGELFVDNGVRLKGIVKTSASNFQNKVYAAKTVYNVPYVELESGVRVIASAGAGRSLKTSVETLVDVVDPGSDNWDTLTTTQKDDVVNFITTFKSFVSNWDMGRLNPIVKTDTVDPFYIYDADDAKLMSAVTGADIQLKANVDMGGAAIDGIENFTGSFYGNGNTISNVTINGIGLVDTVASGKEVSNLKLENVKVVVPADTTATAVGTIVGTNNGTITNVTATGSVSASKDNISAGALVGMNNGQITTGSISVSTTTVKDAKGNVSNVQTLGSNGLENVDAAAHTTSDLAASVGLYVTGSNVNTGLVGSGNAVANASSVYWNDTSYSTERQDATLQARRDVVVEEMFKSGTYKWTPAKSFTHYGGVRETFWGTTVSDPNDTHTQSFTKGTTYYGTPYDHTAASYDQAMYYMTEGANGVYTADVSAATTSWNNTWGSTSPYDGFTLYIGSDCSSAPTMAWHKVSPVLYNSKSNGGISLWYTETIVPSEFNQYYFGIRQVGDYTVNDATMSDGVKLTGTDDEGKTYELTYTNLNKETKYRYKVTTDAIATAIGANEVYEAYAQTRKGDILICSGTGGHCRMLAMDPVVVRKANGTIDPDKSYMVTHEQGDGLYERSTTKSSWRINYKYTFKQLAYLELSSAEKTALTGTDGYYLPVTMEALNDTDISSSGGFSTSATFFNNAGDKTLNFKINSSFRILKAQLIIYDESGNEVYNKTRFQGASNNQLSRRAYPGYAPMYSYECFADYTNYVQVGKTYTYKVIAENVTGGTKTYVNTFTDNNKVNYTLSFTYNPS